MWARCPLHSSARRQGASGFTLIELLVVVGIIGIIAAIAIPGLLRARMTGNENAAIGSLQAVNTGQEQFRQACGGYASTLQDLVAKRCLSPDLQSNGVIHSGYRFAIAVVAAAAEAEIATSCADLAGPIVHEYVVLADPQSLGNTGGNFYATDARHAVYRSPAPIPTPIPPNTPTVAP